MLVCSGRRSGTETGRHGMLHSHIEQESHAVAREPRDVAAAVFDLKFAQQHSLQV